MIRRHRLRRPSSLFLLASAWALTACQPQDQGPSAAEPTVPHQPQAAPPNLATACAEPWGSGPFTEAGPMHSAAPITPPPRAAREHVRGCAGLRFRIGGDGLPTDIEVLVEAPDGYGFGEVAAQALGASRWAARRDESFHYITYVIP